MFDQTWKISDLLFHMKLLKDKVNAFESGEKYVQMQEQHRKDVAFLNRRIIELEKEAARAHAETVDVRNKWFETCEDVVKEKEAELLRKDKELTRMEEKMFEAQRQRDEALGKYREKNPELYDVKTQLEEALGKLKELTARVNRDYTNSSKSSSMSPNHKKIPNSR